MPQKGEGLRQPLVASILLGLLLTGCGTATIAPTSDPGPTLVVTPVPGAPSHDLLGAEVIVGGVEVDKEPGAVATPVLGADAAVQIVAAELAAGRARMIGTHADNPPMHPVDAAFVPGLMRLIGPTGATDFEVPEPVPAWVVVFEGRGSDGSYTGVGIVGQDGRPLAVYVTTPGVG